jgi:hypothetical protein
MKVNRWREGMGGVALLLLLVIVFVACLKYGPTLGLRQVSSRNSKGVVVISGPLQPSQVTPTATTDVSSTDRPAAFFINEEGYVTQLVPRDH